MSKGTLRDTIVWNCCTWRVGFRSEPWRVSSGLMTLAGSTEKGPFYPKVG